MIADVSLCLTLDRVAKIEADIDTMDSELPALKNFILPSGGRSEPSSTQSSLNFRISHRHCVLTMYIAGLASAHLHVCRTAARRAERATVPLVRAEAVEPAVGIYLNRLSDYFFVAARYAALKDGQPETVYKKWEGTTTREQ